MKSLSNCFPYFEYGSINDLSVIDQDLVEKSFDAAKKAYAPYSTFKVGAALRLENTIVVEGSNQENAAFPEGLCAERVTLFTASHKFPNVAGHTLAISAFSDDQLVETPVTPCGGCRQVIAEYVQRHKKTIRLLLVGKKKIIVVEDAMYLLPFSFGRDNMDQGL